MHGAVEIKDGEGSPEHGESSCSEAGTSDEAFGAHATELHVETGLQRQESDTSPEDGVEAYSEGDIGAQSEDFSDHHGQGDAHWEPREALTFNTSLASAHTYLGGLGDVEDVGSDGFNGAGGAVLKLPMFYLEGIVLFPHQKLPLRVLQQRFKAAVSHAMSPVGNDAFQTLGVIHVRVSRRGRIHVANYGTTAKICKVKGQRDGSVNVMTTGKKRFRILTVWTQPDGALFAQVQIVEEDTKKLGDFPGRFNNAFSPMASVFKRRTGRAKPYPTGLSPGWELQAASEDEFYEEPEDVEPNGYYYQAGTRKGQVPEGNHHVVQDESDAEDEGVDEDINEYRDGDESDDFVDAVAGDEEEEDPSDDDDDGTGSHFERPSIRQRLDVESSIGRRMEELEPVGRDPTEGRNREPLEEPLEVSQYTESGFPLEGAVGIEDRGKKEESLSENTTLQVVSVPAARSRGGPYVNPYRKWRKDASRWAMRAPLTTWPHWVYRQYDAFDLARRAADMLRQMGDHPRLEELVSKPTELSYYIGSNMPIQDHTRQELLEIDTTLARLKREIQLLEGMDTLRCNCCREVIAWRRDVFVMSTEGAIGAYVNAHGYVHETLTLSCARNMRIRGAPQTENSWFPGYAWILAKCQACHLNNREQHMGWRFIAVDRNTRPQTFWGIRRTQLIGSSETQAPDAWD
ncbi:uncharacterized protein [Physcomitrium patens]|uniref:Protein cereblon n=1 Tax=Physcomitrium patens TaxID=3218 RepID=A0A2K1IAY2_PHYPA|nr:uncharacterized protein LOC112278416 [Physcomitrium patens]XP_024367648.1 uncharacterized protein LOC112278416 [Physcomitrium patens]XP_024367649.1 uncharacterized protein LOC112278416 [Physcomitrium patens]PNR26435.1 hypothetical protein PHYPA_031010 [Physcomitrium patens]|eukprot:XP_024367647.1 uncharacterized protein LOC112278416 [Physcomitrella patens]